jgi:hypothetical protein
VVLVPKKTGEMRFCVDYRKLNAITKRNVYPLPRIDDLLDSLGCSSYFTTLDPASGYWQIPITPEDKEKRRLSRLKDSSNLMLCRLDYPMLPRPFSVQWTWF